MVAGGASDAKKRTLKRYRGPDLLVQRSLRHIDRPDDASEEAEGRPSAVQRALSTDCSTGGSAEPPRGSIRPCPIHGLHAASLEGTPGDRRSPGRQVVVRRAAAVLPGQGRRPALEHGHPEVFRRPQDRQVVQLQSRSPRSRDQGLGSCRPTGRLARRLCGERTVQLGVHVGRISRRRPGWLGRLDDRMVTMSRRTVRPGVSHVAGITGRLFVRSPVIGRTRGSRGGVGLHGGARRGVVVEGALRGDGHFVPIVAASRRRCLVTVARALTGMASLVGLPIPRTPTSVRRDHVRGALRALYAERPPLVHLDHRLRAVPGVRRGLALRRASRLLRAGRGGGGGGVAGAVAGPVHGAAVPLAGAHGGLSRELRRLPVDAGLPAGLRALEPLVGRVVQLFRVLAGLRRGHGVAGLVRRPPGRRWYGVVLRTNAHTAVPSAGRRTTTGALGGRLLRALLGARLGALRAQLLLLVVMVVVMVMVMIGPVLRAGRSHAEGREAQRYHRVRHPRLEQTLPRLAAVVAHLWFLAGLHLQPLLRRVAHVIALVDVGDVARVVRHLEDQVLGVFLRYHRSRRHQLLAGQDLQARRFTAPVAQVSAGSRDRTRRRFPSQLVQPVLSGLSDVLLQEETGTRRVILMWDSPMQERTMAFRFVALTDGGDRFMEIRLARWYKERERERVESARFVLRNHCCRINVKLLSARYS